MAHRTAAAVALSLALIAGCRPDRAKEPAAGLGRAVWSGTVRALSASPDGAVLAFLDGCQDVNAQFLPPRTARCDLRVVPAAGGDATRIAAGVTTLPHGIAWSPDGKTLAALADFDHAGASGTLVVWRAGVVRTLSDGVTFFGFGANGELGLVARGKLSVLLPADASPRPVAGADAIASFDFAPGTEGACGAGGDDGPRLLARRTHASGGALLAARCALDEARPIEPGRVGDYVFGPGRAVAYTIQDREGAVLKVAPAAAAAGRRPQQAAEVGRRVQSFAFSHDGRALAFVGDVIPGKQGNLHVGGPGRRDVVLAREVGEFRWASGASRLAWLEKYDARVRAGAVGTGGPELAPRTFGQNVTDFEISPDGRFVAFLQHTTRGGYSVDLGLARADPAGKEEPARVAQGVFGFAFSPDGSWLYYRTRCVRNAEACDLERVPVATQGAKPEVVAVGVKSFEFEGSRGAVLLTWQRMDLAALDVGVWEAGQVTKIDTAVLPGSTHLLGSEPFRIAYVVVHPKRAGVYVAELAPRPGAASPASAR